MFQKVYFYIDSMYQWDQGFPNQMTRIAFREETRRIFRCAGWEINPGFSSATCDSATKGRQSLYLHPMEFSGIIQTEEIVPVQNALRTAQSFRLRSIGRFEFYHDMSDEEYKAYLDSRRGEMIEDILTRYKTSRRNLFYTGDMSESVDRKYRILRIGHNEEYDDRAFQYIKELIDELIVKGQLRTGRTKAGMGIRTALQCELKTELSHKERQASA